MIRYRRLGPDDIPVLLGLWKASGLSIRARGRESVKALRAEMARSPEDFIGACVGKKLVGAVIVTSDGRRGYVNRLAVHPDFRRRGIAVELIARSEAELRLRGIGISTALIERGNEASFNLFSEAGYEIREDITYVRKELVRGI